MLHRHVSFLGHSASYERREFACAACGETYTNDAQGNANDRAEQQAVCQTLSVIGADELRFLRELVGLTQNELENALGLGRNTVARWETAQREIPPYIRSLVRLVALNPTALYLLKEQNLCDAERVSLEPTSGRLVEAPKYREPALLQALRPREEQPVASFAVRAILTSPGKHDDKAWTESKVAS